MIRNLAPGAALACFGMTASALLGVLVSRPNPIGPTAIALFLLLLFGVMISRSLVAPVASALLVFFASETELGQAVDVVSVGAKSGAFALLVVLAARCRADRRPTLFAWFAAVAGLAYSWAGYRNPSIIWVVDALGLLLAVLALAMVASRVAAATIGEAVDIALAVSLTFSALLPFTGWTGVIEGGRLEGFFANANTLGFMAAAGVMRATLAWRGGWHWLLLGASALCLIWSGSRAPMLGLGVGVAIALIYSIIRGSNGIHRLVWMALTLAAGGVAFLSIGQEGVGMRRTADTRAEGTGYAFQAVRLYPWDGVGYAGSSVEVASSPLRWLAETGWPGFWLILAAYGVLAVAAWNQSWRTMFVASFGISHSVFEGWLFAGGSSLFVVFWLILFSVQGGQGNLHRRDAYAAANSDVRRFGDKGRRPAGRLLAPQ